MRQDSDALGTIFTVFLRVFSRFRAFQARICGAPLRFLQELDIRRFGDWCKFEQFFLILAVFWGLRGGKLGFGLVWMAGKPLCNPHFHGFLPHGHVVYVIRVG